MQTVTCVTLEKAEVVAALIEKARSGTDYGAGSAKVEFIWDAKQELTGARVEFSGVRTRK